MKISKKQRQLLENYYVSNEAEILRNLDDIDFESFYRFGIIPVKQLSLKHIIKSIDTRYPFSCDVCSLEYSVSEYLNKECINCLNTSFIRVEYSLDENYRNNTSFILISLFDIKKHKGIQKAFSVKTGIDPSMIYHYSEDELYDNSGKLKD